LKDNNIANDEFRWRHMLAKNALYKQNWEEGNYTLYAHIAHTSPIRAVAYDPSQYDSDSVFLTGSDDSFIKVWRLSDRTCAHSIHTQSPVSCIQHTGHIIVSGSTADCGVVVYSLNERERGAYSHEIRQQLKGHTDLVTSMQFDEIKVASCSYDTTLKIWDMQTGGKIWDVSPDGVFLWALQYVDNTLMLGSSARETTMFDLRSHTKVDSFKGHKGSVYCLQFDANSNMLVSGSGDDTVKIYDMRNSVAPLATLSGHKNCVDTIHCVGDRLVSGSRDHHLNVWDLRSFKCYYTLSEHTGSVWGLKTDTRYCISVGNDKTVHVWDFGILFNKRRE